MNELLKKIYQEVICYEEENVQICSETDKEIMQLMKTFAVNLSEKDQQELKELLYAVALVGEQAGFEIGFKTAIKIIT